MEVQRLGLVAVDLVGGPGGGVLRHAHRHQHPDQLGALGLRVLAEGPAFHAHLRLDLLVGRRHRGELTEPHRERTRQQARDAGHHDGLSASAGGDARDERGVAHQAVHRPERRRAQPATRHVGVLVVDLIWQAFGGRAVRFGHDGDSTRIPM